MGKLVKSKKLIGRRISTAKTKLGKNQVQLLTDNSGSYPEHDVVVTRDGKKRVVLDNEPDLSEAFEVWEKESKVESTRFKDAIKPLDLTKNDRIVANSLKSVFEENKKASGWITSRKLEDKLGERLRIKGATAERVAMLIARLESRGLIETRYRAGLPMYGVGLGGDPQKRLIKIQFMEEY